jgi:hypothetical protein
MAERVPKVNRATQARGLFFVDSNCLVSPAMGRWRSEPEVYIESEHECTSHHDQLRNCLGCAPSRMEPNARISIGVAESWAAHIGDSAVRSGKKARWENKYNELALAE